MHKYIPVIEVLINKILLTLIVLLYYSKFFLLVDICFRKLTCMMSWIDFTYISIHRILLLLLVLLVLEVC